MAEYIEREVLYKTIAKNVEVFDDAGTNIKEQCLEHIVIAEPAADVVEVVHGHWVKYKAAHYKCSICDNRVGGITTKYCSECGAKMDGERRSDE